MTDSTKTTLEPADKSAIKEAQYKRVDNLFDYPGKLISTIEFRNCGVIHPSGRIKEMNERQGYSIAKVAQRTVYDEQGFPHPRIAFYELIERPKRSESKPAERG
nr:helix-turn-helix domain-containing protein [uncultured Rhodoferax sp.]